MDRDLLWFLYDSDGTRVGFSYKDTDYFYTKNAQGDVTGITDSNCNTVVEYNYDAWGKLLSTAGSMADTIAKLNPFLYRGYYFDAETGLYYLNSRYYDAQTGRFISADGAISGVGGDILGYNLFAYCHNNPVNMSDSSGHWPNWIVNVANTIKKTVNAVVSAVKSMGSSLSVVLASIKNKNKLPMEGEPNSTVKAPNGNGREYGPDGKAKKDTDYSHPEHHPELKNPHSHDWSWDGGIPKRGPAYNFDAGTVFLGVGLVAGSAAAMLWVVGNDVTEIGTVDDFTLPALGGTFSKGVIMIFGG